GAGLQVGIECFQGVGTIRLAAPFQGWRSAPGRTGNGNDLVTDDEAGEQADAELADEIGGLFPEFGALGGLANGRQEVMDLLLGQGDAVIAEDKSWRPATALGDKLESDFAAKIRLQELASTDGVGTILQQLAQEDLRAAVEVIGQQVDDAAQIDLEPE